MSYYVEDRGRVGRSAYWMYFGGFVVLTMLLLVGGGYELFTGSYGMGILCIVLLMPLGIYFRVIAMRRCRDIGWPAFLPWATMGLVFICNIMTGMSAGMHAAAHMGTAGAGAAGLGASMGFGMLLSMVDFVFLIVIGCLDTQGGGYDPSSGFAYDPRNMPQAPKGYLGDLDGAPADQRAMRIPQGLGERPVAPPAGSSYDAPQMGGPASGQATGVTRPAQGFGRRGV